MNSRRETGYHPGRARGIDAHLPGRKNQRALGPTRSRAHPRAHGERNPDMQYGLRRSTRRFVVFAIALVAAAALLLTPVAGIAAHPARASAAAHQAKHKRHTKKKRSSCATHRRAKRHAKSRAKRPAR